MLKNLKKILYPAVLIVLLGSFAFKDNLLSSGWHQQFMPDLLGRRIIDIAFADSLNGFAIADTSGGNKSIILKTSNGGDNWFIIYQDSLKRVYLNLEVNKINNNIYVSSNSALSSGARLLKSTDLGISWQILNNPASIGYIDMSIVDNEIWIANATAFDGGVWKTTNGGQNWERKYYAGLSGNPNKIYMINNNIGFIAYQNQYTRKTTDGGNTWPQVNDTGYYQLAFLDSLNGYMLLFDYNVYKTTDGGLNWITQPLLSGGNIFQSGMYELTIVNKDTLWGTGAIYNTGNFNFRGMIWKTTNGGNNWGYQLPDVQVNIGGFTYIDFSDKNHGWTYYAGRLNGTYTGVHTKTGGDTTTYFTGITQIGSELPASFILHQNFPNPFNPVTNIRYEIKKSASVNLKIYDVTGKEVTQLVNEFQQPGIYQVTFEGNHFPSGIYFYTIQAENFKASKKMLMIK